MALLRPRKAKVAKRTITLLNLPQRLNNVLFNEMPSHEKRNIFHLIKCLIER